MSAKKIGRFSEADIKYIASHCHNNSVDDMAEALNRTPDSIRNQIARMGFEIEKTDDEVELETRLKAQLWNLAFWPAILEAYDDSEVEFFENNWIAFVKQLNEDLTYTEYVYLKDWVQLEIEKKRLLQGQKETRDNIRELKETIKSIEAVGDLDPQEIVKVAQAKQELNFMRSAEGQHVGNLEKINKDIKNISSKLKADRDNRRDVKGTADTFWSLVSALDDSKKLAEHEQMAELMKASMLKAKNKLQEWHTYIDGELDKPILNEESLSLEDE